MANRKTNPSAENSSTEPLVIDVRTSEEFASGAYPLAINM